jgi:CheY-like chemotaxis protein
VSQSYPKFDRPLAVLHVDDDPMNLRVVEEILGAFHHTSAKVMSGAEALQMLAERAFDIILMDIHMPGMTGIETVERVRGLPGPEREIPVIALTADVFTRRPEEYRALGFNDFVSKPILVADLLNAIKRAAEPPKGALSAANAA